MMFRILSWSLILFACFYGIGSYPLLDNNEGLYASIARDMLANKQFIIPHLAGMPYLEKPPMLYWLMAGSMSIFGVNEWAVHLVPALAYFLTAVALKRFVTRITGNEKTGLAAALMMATSLPMLVFGREVLCDMMMTCFFSAALFEIYLWQEKRGKCHLLAFYAFLALAVLTKGLIVIVLAGGITLTFYLWERQPLRHYFHTLPLLGIVIFFCIAAPWHIAASLQEQGFAWFYFINEHVLRFIGKREPHDYHTGSWWYYLPRILAYLVPWTLFLLIFLRPPFIFSPPPEGGAGGGVHLKSPPTPTLPLKGGGRSVVRFLWSWFFVCLIFFSFAGSKANYYMLIGMPPLIALTTLHLKYATDAGSRVVRSLASGSFAVLFTLLWFIQHFCSINYDFLLPFCENAPPDYITGLAVYSIACIILCWRIPQHWLFPLLGSHIIVLLPLLINGASNTNEMISQKAVAEQLQSTPSPQVAIYQDFEDVSALAFYLKKPILIVDSHSNDLLYGKNKQVKPSMFPSLNEWVAHKPYVPMVVLKNKLFSLMDTLHDQHVDMKHVCILQRFERVIIVSMCDK